MLLRKGSAIFWQGYADSTPSESIQPHGVPAISVSTIFPYHPKENLLDVPVGQYKAVPTKRKGARALEFSNWLKGEKENGLTFTGVLHAHKQKSAASLGLELIEELQDARCEKHFETFRLYYGNSWIDLAQAVALIYYWFTLNFAALRAAQRMPTEHRNLIVAMDRFPGPSPKDRVPGKPLPASQGRLFIEYVRRNSSS